LRALKDFPALLITALPAAGRDPKRGFHRFSLPKGFDITWMGMRRSFILYSMTRWIAQGVFSLFYRIEIRTKGLFHFDGPVIILPKHQYWTDVPLVSLSFRFPLLFMAKRELFRYPGVGIFLSLLGGVPLDRERSLRTLNSFRYLSTQLKAAERIVIFPEGTYVRGVVGSGKSRLLQMILRFQSRSGQRIPFIPVGICYGGRARLRRRVEISIGSPLFAESELEAPALIRRVMEEISQLCRMPNVNQG
jgi:1-acyl-sn-glycerol-3-phosphate acyltransferase